MPSKLDGPGIAAVAAGSLITFAGFKGFSILQAIQNVIQGKNPNEGQATTGLTSQSGSSGGGSGGVTIVGGSWSKSLLASGGFPQTPANIGSINAWQQREGGGGQNNPLNTTQKMPGSTSFNSVGVQNYPSMQEGVRATLITLHNGRYNDILMRLRSGNGFLGVPLAGLSTWSGGGYSSV